MNTLYTTSATAVGGRDGHVKSADGQIDINLKTPGAPGDNTGTTPEDLFAAGYAACFNGAFNLAARLKRIKTGEVSVNVEISLNKTDDGKLQLAAKITAHVPDVDEKTARELIEDAHSICPYSRATQGNIPVQLEVTR
ncbi:MAG: organic hydroperoxide resistance protein [Dysgonamonadaceae bacterium]|jgi:Ohr subfamily peroxiredoxin|nr:organic hydroperoxide resistance protein [Dysgonamonadaceae bacterium]